MWFPRVIPRFRAAFSVHAHSPAPAPFCVLCATRRNTSCQSPVGRLGLRLCRGHFSVTAEFFFGCFPPSETPSTILHRKQQNMQVPHLSWFTFGGCLHGAAHDKFEGNHVVAWEGPHARLS